MEFFKPLLDAIREIVREEIKQLIQTLTNEDRWIDRNELSEYLGVSKSWIDVRIKDIPHIKEPFRFKKSEVDEWLKERNEVIKTESIRVNSKQKKNSFKVS